MPTSFSKRASGIIQAEIRSMSIECERMGGINLAQGVCDTEVPLPIRRETHIAIDNGFNSYTRYDGLKDLRVSISNKLQTYNGITANPETDIVVSCGSTGAFYCACLALLDPGDEVVLFEPFYGYHVNTLLAVGAVPAYVSLQPPKWEFEIVKLRKTITPRTKGIMINTPANPSGKVFSRTELDGIYKVAEEFDLFVFTDEIYEYFIYEGNKHISPGSLPGQFDRTITISGFSKTFSITGWRIGYSISNPMWAQIIGYMNDLIYVCAPAPLQKGVASAMDQLSPSFYKDLSREYEEKRDQICKALKQTGLEPFVPEGAYYVLANVSSLPGKSSKEKAMYLLSKTGVATVPGDAFFSGPEGNNLVRICFAKSNHEIVEACQRIQSLN